MSALLALALLAAPESYSEILARGGKVRVSPQPVEVIRYNECLSSHLQILSSQLPRADYTQLRAGAVAACQEQRSAAAVRVAASLKGKRFRDPLKRQAEVERILEDAELGRLFLLQATRAAPEFSPAAAAPQLPPAQPSQPALSVEQAEIVYDQCLARAAAKASRTDAPAEAIFGIARSACADARAMLLVQSGGAAAPLFDAIDAERAASFPARTKQLRDTLREAGLAPAGPK